MTDARFRKVFDEGPFGMAFVGPDLRIIEPNSALCEMLGYSATEIVGRAFAEITHPEDVEPDIRQAQRLFDGEIPYYQMEKRYVRKDGCIVWARLTASILHEDGERVTLGLGILEDISEQKRAEDALRNSEAKHRALLSVIPDTIFQISRDGVFLDFVPARGFQPQVPPGEFLGRSMRELMAPALVDQSLHHIARALDNGDVQAFEYDLEQSGDLRTYEARIVPAVDDTVLAVIRDISDRKRAEEALRESEQRLRTLVEHAPEVIVIFDVDTGRFTEVNQNAVELFGLSRLELLARGPIEVSPPIQPDGQPSPAAATGYIEQALDGKIPLFEWVHRTATGRDIPCEVRLVRLPFAGRRLVRGSITNITDRREVADAVRASRDALRAVFDASPLPTHMIDRDGFVRMWNAAAQQTFGWTADEVLGRRPPNVTRDLQEEYDLLRRRVLSGESVRGVETQRVTKDGKIIDVSLSASPLVESHGSVIGIVNAVVDITRRKQAEQALRESEVKYRALVEHATYGIFRASHDGRFLAVNPALVEMLGYETPEELMTVDIAHDVYTDPIQRRHLMRRYATVDRVDGVETKWKQKDGSVITVRLSGRAVRAADRTIQAVEMIAEDVTKQRGLETQLRQAQKMEAIGQLTGGIAHDFNNILTAVLSNAELIAGALSAEHAVLRSEIDDIRDAARRGAAMIRKLMAFSRREHLDMQRYDLGDVIEDLAPMLRRLLPEHIEVRVAQGRGHTLVRADRGAIEQIVLNLATNARDAMPDGGVLEIETCAKTLDDQHRAAHGWGEPGDYVCLNVADTGMGIADSIRSKIFEPFFTTKPPGEGTGLGMAMVYGLVKQHGGFISLDSDIGRGTSVRIYLPADFAGGPVGSLGHSDSSACGGTETILLVEDEEVIRRASQRVLERFGYDVRVAADGQEALSVLRNPSVTVDLVVTDVVMPRLGGQKLYEAAREAGIDVKFIFTSGYAARDMYEAADFDHEIPFLHKPWTVNDLLQRIREVLDQREQVSGGRIR